MPELKLFLFGPPRVELNGTPVDIQRRKALAMLIYLAITGQPHSRDALAALFYPDHSQSQSRTYLRRDLALLNTNLSGDWLAVDRETVELKQEQPAFWLDVSHFRRLLAACQGHKHAPGRPCADCLARQAEAVTLYTGDFLAGFSLRDCPDFDDWQFFQNESLRRELAVVLEQLVDGFSRQNQPELAIPHARRWIGLDPLHEPAQRALIQLYDQTGQLAAALRQYEEYAELLEAEFGLPPEEETMTLYEAIKAKRMLGPFLKAEAQKGIEAAAQKEFDFPLESRPPKDSLIRDREPQRFQSSQEFAAELLSASDHQAVLAPAAQHAEQTIPLVGRTRELEILQSKLQAARQGQGSVVLLAGDSGVGKTRLAHEALHAAELSGMTILAGAAYEQESHLPYQPFIEAFDRYLAEQRRPPEQHPISHYKPVRKGDLQQEHAALFKATATFLTGLATHRPVIMLLDDLHAADEASLSLFHYLARQTRAAPLILLATYRTDLLMPPMSPFGRLLNGLYREHFSETLHLPQLAEQDTAQIISYILSGAASPALIQSVFDITEGNPFFIQEIIQAMLKADQLWQEAGRWRLRPGVSLAAPAQLQDLLRERIQRLGSTVEPALSAAAVIGREFRFSVLAAITGLAEAELLDVMDAALEGNLLEEKEEGYRFRHALIRQTLYDGLSQARRAWLHTRTAEAIEALYSDRPEALRPHVEALAFHYRHSNSRDRTLPYLLQAGQKAIESYAVEVALNYFKEALALMDELGLDDRAQRWQILRRLGWCAYVLADTLQAVACLEQALALAPTESWQPSARDRLQLHLSAAFALTTAGNMAAAIRHLHAAMTEVGETGGGSAEYAHLLYQVALQHWHQDEYQEAFEVARWSLEVANPLNDREAMARAYEILALSAHSLGNWQQGLNFEEQRARLVGPNPDVSSAFDAHLCLWEYHLYGDKPYAEVKQSVETTLQQAQRMGAPRAIALCRSIDGVLEFQAGRWSEAEAALREAVQLNRQLGAAAGEALACQHLGVLLTARGQLDEGLAILEEGLMAAEQANMRVHCLIRLYAAISRNRLLAGDLEAAGYALSLGLSMSERHGHCCTCESLLLPVAVTVLIAQGELAAAEDYCRQLDEAAARYGSRIWLALAGQTRGELAAAQGDIEAALNYFKHAQTEFELAGNSYQATQCRTALARLREQQER